MARLTTIQAAHTYGVLDPLVVERRDTKFVDGSLSDGDNIVLLPQGGYADRGGTTDFGRVRRKLAAIAIDQTILSLPNGGSESDLLAGTAVTTSAVAGTRHVLFACTFGAPVLVHMIDIRGLKIATTAAASALVAEYWNGSGWVAFAPAGRIDLVARGRRFAAGAPGHAGITATQFRIAVNATAGAAGAVTFSGIALWAESADLADAIVRRYAPENGVAHQLVFSAGNVDVFVGGVWQASALIPHDEAQLRVMKTEARLDTVLLWHKDVQPHGLMRLGTALEWACTPVEFKNVPLVDYGGVYTNGVNEVQEIRLYQLNVGDSFELTCEGQTTTGIVYNSSGAVTGAAIKSALEALSNVGTGLTVTVVSGNTWSLEFTGPDNMERDWLPIVGTSLGGPGSYVFVKTTQKGKKPGEDMISGTRGWPSIGRFAQQRLIMAGMRSRPNEVLASQTGDPYDLNVELEAATKAFSYEIDNSTNNEIRDIYVGRTLFFLGDQQLCFLKNRVLSGTEVPEFGASDSPGIKPTGVVVSSDNAVYYIQDGGKSLRLATYTELEQNFVGDSASVLSAFLIRDPSELFRRRARDRLDSDLLMMVNADGTITSHTVMRTQDVSGFAPWSTDGLFVSGCVDHDNETWFIVQRLVDGVAELRLERHDPEKLLDEAVEIVLGAAASTLAGLSRFNAREVWAQANDRLYGPFTVSGGEITLPAAVTGTVRVGTWRAPLATDPPVNLTMETRQRHARMKRVNRAEISVHETTSLAIRANDGDAINLPLRSNAGTIADEGPLARPFTGRVEAEGMHGFTDHGQVTLTQTYPGRLTVRALTKTVAA